MHIHIEIYIYVCICMYIYVYIHYSIDILREECVFVCVKVNILNTLLLQSL